MARIPCNPDVCTRKKRGITAVSILSSDPHQSSSRTTKIYRVSLVAAQKRSLPGRKDMQRATAAFSRCEFVRAWLPGRGV